MRHLPSPIPHRMYDLEDLDELDRMKEALDRQAEANRPSVPCVERVEPDPLPEEPEELLFPDTVVEIESLSDEQLVETALAPDPLVGFFTRTFPRSVLSRKET